MWRAAWQTLTKSRTNANLIDREGSEESPAAASRPLCSRRLDLILFQSWSMYISSYYHYYYSHLLFLSLFYLFLLLSSIISSTRLIVAAPTKNTQTPMLHKIFPHAEFTKSHIEEKLIFRRKWRVNKYKFQLLNETDIFKACSNNDILDCIKNHFDVISGGGTG